MREKRGGIGFETVAGMGGGYRRNTLAQHHYRIGDGLELLQFSGLLETTIKLKAGFYSNKIVSKTLGFAQDFPNKILFSFLWVNIYAKNLPRFSDGRKCSLLAKS